MNDLASARSAIERCVLDVADFPSPGVLFKDITPLLGDAKGLAAVTSALAGAGRDSSGRVVVDKVAGMESRGFIFAAPVALALGVGFVPVRKPGKLPRDTHAIEYDLEYGSATLEVHQDAFSPGDRVLVVDDVLATGGTLEATVELISQCGAVAVGAAVLLELGFLNPRQRLNQLACHSLQVL